MKYKKNQTLQIKLINSLIFEMKIPQFHRRNILKHISVFFLQKRILQGRLVHTGYQYILDNVNFFVIGII